MTTALRTLRLAVTLHAALWCAASPAQPRADGIAPYRAVYALLDDGNRVGDSVFTLHYDPASDRYVFETRSEFHGLLRFLAPRPIVERSEFDVVAGEIRPLAFSYQDGTRRGRRDVTVRFDWQARRLIADRAGEREQLPLAPSTLDRASARVALMRDLAAAERAGRYMIADPVEIETYEYRSEGMDTVMTGAGRFAADKIRQQRPGSSRRTLIWAAPALDFLPVRIEQIRDGRGPVAFVLESIEWLGGDDTGERAARE